MTQDDRDRDGEEPRGDDVPEGFKPLGTEKDDPADISDDEADGGVGDMTRREYRQSMTEQS
jgi:hypothetical protein